MSTLGIIAGNVLGRVVIGKILPNIGRLGSIEPGRYPHPIYGPIVIPPTPSLKPGDPNVPPPAKVQITLAGFLGGVALAAWLYDRSKQKEALSYIPGPEAADPVEECLLNYGWNLADIRILKASIDAKSGTGEEFTAEENRILDHIEGCLDIVEEQYGTLDMAGLIPCNCSDDEDTEGESPGPGGELSGDIMTCAEWRIVKNRKGEDVIKCSEYRATCHPTGGCIYGSPEKPVTARQRRQREKAKAKRKPLPADIAETFEETRQYYIEEVLPYSFSFPPALENEIKRKLFFDNVKKFPDPLKADEVLKPHMDDLVEELKSEFMVMAKSSEVAETQRILEEEGLSKNEQTVIKAMAGESMSMDQIHEKTGLPIEKLSAALVNLELKGFVHRKPGKIFEPVFFGIEPELFRVPRGQVVLHVQDPGKSEDLLLQCLERRGWKPKRVQELQEKIAAKLTPSLFTQEPEKLTGGEIMLQEAIDECLQQITGKPPRGRSGEQMTLLSGEGCRDKEGRFVPVPQCTGRMLRREEKRPPQVECEVEAQEVEPGTFEARYEKVLKLMDKGYRDADDIAMKLDIRMKKMVEILGFMLSENLILDCGRGRYAPRYIITRRRRIPEKPEISPTEQYKKEWERAKRKAYRVKAEKVEAGTFDPTHERILKLIEEGNRDQEALEMESGISHREMNIILNDMVVKDLIVPRQSGMYSAKYKIVPKKQVKAEVDPWMTDAPFTDKEQSYANMYTHFPLDWNNEFAKQVGNTENVVRKRLREFGVDELPPELFEALERYRKAVYDGYKSKWGIRAYFPPVSVVGPSKYPYHRKEKAEARERKVTESIERARKKVDTLANRAIKGKVPVITIGQYLDVAATNSRTTFGKQYAMLEMQDKPHTRGFEHVYRKRGRELHRQLVEEAIKQGKQVLWVAVKDYPELQSYGRITDRPLKSQMPETQHPRIINAKPKGGKPRGYQAFLKFIPGEEYRDAKFLWVWGKPIKIRGFENYQFFMSKYEGKYNVHEASSGKTLGPGYTSMDAAHVNAEKTLEDKKGYFDEALQREKKIYDYEGMMPIYEDMMSKIPVKFQPGMEASGTKGLGYAVSPRERRAGMKLVYLFRRKGQRKPRATNKDAFHYFLSRPEQGDVYATYAYSAEHARELIKKGEVKPYTGEGDVYKPEEAHIAAEKGHIKPLHTMTHSELVDTPFFTSAELPPFMTWMIDKSKVDEHGFQREFRGKLPYRMRKNLYSWLLKHQDGVKSGRHEGQFSIELPEGKVSFYIPENVYSQTRLWIDRFGVWKEAVGKAIREGKTMYSSVIQEYRKFAEGTRKMLEERPNAPEAPQMRKEAEEMEANLRVYDEAQRRWQSMREEARREVREAIRKPETAERKPEPAKPRPILRMPERKEKIAEPEQLRLFGRLSRAGGI